MSDHLYQHYRPEEQPFIDQALDWLQQVNSYYSPITTNFLTPREASILQALVASDDDLMVYFSGGYAEAERQRAIIAPVYYELDQEDFQLSLLAVDYPVKFGQLSHGRILGSLMSTGIDRDRTGDIITDGQAWHILVDQSIAAYLQNQVDKIANVGVRLESLPLDQVLESNEEWLVETLFSSSLRLDSLLGNVYNFSRQRAKDSIYQGLVKVNFVEVNRPDIVINVDDIVSLRKHGRFKIKQIEGKSKKDNYRLEVHILQ